VPPTVLVVDDDPAIRILQSVVTFIASYGVIDGKMQDLAGKQRLPLSGRACLEYVRNAYIRFSRGNRRLLQQPPTARQACDRRDARSRCAKR
jgi:hypothetical protein